MRAGRWVLLLLYLALVGGLGASVLISGEEWTWVVGGVTLTSSAVFILGAGHKNLFRPIGRPRIFFPVVSASLMLTALLFGLVAALMELLDLESRDSESWSVLLFWGGMLATWIFWGIVLTIYTRKLPRYQAIYQLTRFIFAGSVAELLASVPSHIIVSKRPGCLTGILTAFGLFAGLLVMIWSFGPAIFLLFLRAAQDAKERGRASKAETASTKPKLPQFRLSTLMLAILFIAVVCGLLRCFWGQWPVAVVAAWSFLLLVVPLFLSRPRIMLAFLLGVVVGLIYITEGESWPLAIVMPAGLLGIVLLKAVFLGAEVGPSMQITGEEHSSSKTGQV
jgi:hypothetical protein